MSDSTKGKHRATFSKDKLSGGFKVRIVGPYANRFAGREVPVNLADGTTKPVTLGDVVWSGKDDGAVIPSDEGKPVALYTFEAEAKSKADIEF